jgi:hypothetical protein
MTKILIIGLIWKAGALLSYAMMRTEHTAEGETYTKGDRVGCVVLSVFSFAMVLFMAARAWWKQIAATGHWNKPVKQKPE